MNIVLVGSFNPAIFQPFWFAKHDLISATAAAEADISVVHPEVSSFAIGNEFQLVAQHDRLLISRNVAPWIFIMDLAVHMFGGLLPHTPIVRFGVNRIIHFSVGSQETRNKIGEVLAPREPWGTFGEQTKLGIGSKQGGLISMTLVDRSPEGRESGHVQVKVEPSTKIGEGRTGIYMEVNDQFDLPGADDASRAVDLLQDQFDQSIIRAETIVDTVMALAT